MAYVTPGTVAAGDVATAAAWNVLTNDVISHEARMGLQSIVPTSVTVGSGSASTSTNGQVTFTTASSVSLNGVFTSTYKNYRILFNTTTGSGAGTVTIRLRAAGSDITAANYLSQTIQNSGNGAPAGSIVSSQTSWAYFLQGSNAAHINSLIWDLFNPQVTQATSGVSVNGVIDSDDNSRVLLRSQIYQATTSADGISFIMSANNFTGSVTIYGYNQ